MYFYPHQYVWRVFQIIIFLRRNKRVARITQKKYAGAYPLITLASSK